MDFLSECLFEYLIPHLHVTARKLTANYIFLYVVIYSMTVMNDTWLVRCSNV